MTNIACWLLDPAQNTVSNIFNDSTGHYTFAGLTDGCYEVAFPLLSSVGYVFTVPNAGPDDIDSDATGTTSGGFTPLLCVTNADMTHVDAGYYRLTASISLTVLAGSAPNGGTLYVTGGTVVAYIYAVTNSGETYLTPVIVDDEDLGTIFDVSPPNSIAPGGVRTQTQLVAVVHSVTNAAIAVGFAANFKAIPISGIDPAFDQDDAIVVVVPNGDTDLDGLTDLQEYQIGTDPNDPLSYLPPVAMAPPNARIANLVVNPSSTARLYRIVAETNLLSGPQSWTPYGPVLTGTGASITFLVTNDGPVRFYRSAGQQP